MTCGAGVVSAGAVVFWLLSAADGAAARAPARERRQRMMDDC
jgi:hypothetical protein